MKKILLITLLFSIKQAEAQLCFNPATNVAVGAGPVSVCSADFNGDGKADLAAVNDTSNTVSILLGNGTGGFSSAANFPVGSNPSWVISDDFNGDAKADLAVANYSSSNISILYGNGTGSFSTTTYTLAPMARPISLISADFNKDGKPDMATCNYGNTSITVLFGTGTGFTDTTLSSWVTSSDVSSLTAVDFNGDSYLDIIALTGLDFNIIFGDGAGHFPYYTNLSMFSSTQSTVISPDINSDGLNDLLVCDGGSGGTFIYLNSSTGMNPGPVGFGIPGYSCYPFYFMSAGDFNGDSKIDIATVSNCTDSVMIYLGDGAGNFSGYTSFWAGKTPFNLTNCDVNGDGMPDIITTNDNIMNLSVLINCASSCVAAVTDTLFNISPLNWGVLANYSPQITSAVWTWGDGTSTTGLYPSHTYTTAGWYSICVTAYTSCGDSANTCLYDSLYRMSSNSSMINVNVVSSLNDINLIKSNFAQLSIYPNPANTTINISSSKNIDEIKITDVLGAEIISQKFEVKSGTADLDVSTLQNGIYFISIVSGKETSTRKLVISH